MCARWYCGPPLACAASAASTSASLTLMRVCAKRWRRRWMVSSSRSELRKSANVCPCCSELRAHLLGAHLVLAGDVGDRGVDFLVADAHAGLGGRGATSRRTRIRRSSTWRRSTSAGGSWSGRLAYCAADVAFGAIEFALQDHVLVDDRDDAVERLRPARRAGAGRRRRSSTGQGKEASEQSVHGVMSGELSSSPLPSELRWAVRGRDPRGSSRG